MRMQVDHIQNTKGFISVLKLVIDVGYRSWKNDERVMENHGIIMKFDSTKALGSLNDDLGGWSGGYWKKK